MHKKLTKIKRTARAVKMAIWTALLRALECSKLSAVTNSLEPAASQSDTG